MTSVRADLAAAYKQCLIKFEDLVSKSLDLKQKISIKHQQWEDEFGRLKVWGNNIGAHQVGKRTSLEFRLRDAEITRNQILNLLTSLFDALEEATQALPAVERENEPIKQKQQSGWSGLQFGNVNSFKTTVTSAFSTISNTFWGSSDEPTSTALARSPDEDSKLLSISDTGTSSQTKDNTVIPPRDSASDADDAPSDDSQEDIDLLELSYLDVIDLITNLYRMSQYIRHPSRRDQVIRRNLEGVSSFKDFDIGHARDKFPTSSITLRERLGHANTVRRANIRYWESHHRKLAHDQEDEDEDDMKSKAALSSTVATSFAENLATQAEIGEDDTRSEAGMSQTSYAHSFMEGDNVRLPARPTAGKDGALFECPICYYVITANTEISWLKHIFFDLQPYVCLFEDCKTPNQLFTSRNDWFEHEMSYHIRPHQDQQNDVTISCPLCSEATLSIIQARRHLGRHLEEFCLFALPASVLETLEEGDEIDNDHNNQSSSVSAQTSVTNQSFQEDDTTMFVHGREEEPGNGDIYSDTRSFSSSPRFVDPMLKRMLDTVPDYGRTKRETIANSEQISSRRISNISDSDNSDVSFRMSESSQIDARAVGSNNKQESGPIQGRYHSRAAHSAAASSLRDLLDKPWRTDVSANAPSHRDRSPGFSDLPERSRYASDRLDHVSSSQTYTRSRSPAFNKDEENDIYKVSPTGIASEAELDLLPESTRGRQASTSDSSPQRLTAAIESAKSQLTVLSTKFETDLVPKCEAFITSLPTDSDELKSRHHQLSEEILVQIMMAADSVEAESDLGVRRQRQNLIAECNRMMRRLDRTLNSKPG